MTQKGSLPQKGPKLPQIGISCLSGGDTQTSCVQSKFQAKRLKVAPFMTDRTFWDPKLPHCHRPIWDKNQEFRTVPPFRYHNQRETCQISNKMDNRFKIMRHRNFCAPKRVNPPKGVQIGPKLKFSVFQVEIPWNHVYSPNLKRNGCKLLHLWPTALCGTQNCPIPIGPFSDRITKLWTYHLLDIITKEKPDKFPIKWTTAWKVMRPHNFWVPKRVSTPKGAQIIPKINFSIFQVEIPSNNEYRPNLKPNGWKLLNLWPTALFGTQNCPIYIGPFWVKIRNLGPYHLLDIISEEKPAKCQTKWTTASKVMRHHNFWVPKRVSTQKGPKSGPYEIFLFFRWRYLEIMGTNQIWSETAWNFSI